jgi:glycosyltransferase involved in cell wall biosynthesis
VRIGFLAAGGFDRSGCDRVTPVLLTLVERLARDHDVHVFILDYCPEPCTYSLAGATIHDVGRVTGPPGLRRYALRRRLSSALDRVGRFDVLHAYMGVPAGLASVFAGRSRGIPVVATFDSGELSSIDDLSYGLQRRWLDRRAVSAVARMASRVTVCSEYMWKQQTLRAAAVDIVPIGVDPRLFTSEGRSDGPPWRLLRVASINRVKDYPTLLHAFRIVVERLGADGGPGGNIQLDIVGEDTLNGSIQALSRTLGLGARVAFHGVQPIDCVASFYTHAHLHVSASRHEAAGVTTLEAACSGLPTVGTAVGYVADWTANAANGPELAVGVPVGNPAALADAIVALIRDPARRSRIAASARAWATTHDADWTARRFETIYREVARPATREPR